MEAVLKGEIEPTPEQTERATRAHTEVLWVRMTPGTAQLKRWHSRDSTEDTPQPVEVRRVIGWLADHQNDAQNTEVRGAVADKLGVPDKELFDWYLDLTVGFTPNGFELISYILTGEKVKIAPMDISKEQIAYMEAVLKGEIELTPQQTKRATRAHTEVLWIQWTPRTTRLRRWHSRGSTRDTPQPVEVSRVVKELSLGNSSFPPQKKFSTPTKEN